MSKPHVTITLGSSGQKVVKRSAASQRTSFGQHTLSGGKRQPASQGGRLLSESNKRTRGDKDAGGSRYGGQNDARVGQNDLRLKLMRKRRQREILLEIEKRKKEMHKKAGSIQSAERSQRRLPLVPISRPSSRASELLQMEAIRSPYVSQTSGGVRPKSPNTLAKDSGEVSSPRNIAAAQNVPSIRPVEASRVAHSLASDHLNPSQLKGLIPVTTRSTVVAGNISCLSLANRSMLQSSSPDQPPMTVAGLLNSLGLGKYVILFQAEEVDMAALKQMGDRDLKELGIPMGPRKKILMAMLPRAKRPVI